MEKKVEIVESILVAPSEATPKETIWLSNLDFPTPRGSCYTSNLQLYPYNGDSDFFSIETLKAALAKALVFFYPLAGRLVSDQNGRLELECTGEGVRFIVARSQYMVEEFDLSSNMSLEFVPQAESNEPPFIPAMLQITYLKCKGVCFGATLHHGAIDGHTFLYFTNTWCQIARGIEIPKSLTLSFDRTVFKARSPPQILYDHADEYKVNVKSSSTTVITPTITVEIFKISKEQLLSLKMQMQSPTTFRAVSAHVWRCACRARGLHGDEVTRIFMSANVRSRMTPVLPHGYFGNAHVRTTAKANAGEILSQPLGFAADKITEAIERVNDEYVRSYIDFIEVLGAHEYHDKTLNPNTCRGTNTDLFLVGWLQLPIYENDFGWGKPMYLVKCPLRREGSIYLLKNPDGGVIMTVAFKPETMAKFKRVFYEDLNWTFSRI